MPGRLGTAAPVPINSAIAAEAATVETMADLAQVLRDLHRREARRRGGTALTYRELAKVTGWSRGIIGEYLSGTALPPTDRFDQLVQLLGAAQSEWGPLATARDRIEEHRRLGRAASRPAPPSATAAPPTTPERVPRELPAPVAGFVGRDSLLCELDALAAADRGTLTVAAVCGGGGVGKTALAVRWAHQAADRFPDGNLYIDLRGYGTMRPVDAGDALGRFLQALGLEPARVPADTDARATLYRSMLAGRRTLVVLDNAVSADQVRPLLPGSSSCMVVVTSRDSLAGLVAADGAHRIGVDVLTDREAWALFRSLLGHRVEAQPEAVATLIRLCGRLPLALRVAAEVVGARAEICLAGLVAGLRDQRALLDLLDAGDPHSAVRSVLSWSYRTLSAPAARLFRLLGGEPGPDLSVPAAASLAATTPGTASRLLAELVRAHMITEVAPGRFAPHDVMRAYSAEQLHDTDTAADRAAAVRRLMDHYGHTATRAGAVLNPARVRLDGPPAADGAIVTPIESGPAALAWFTGERLALLAAARLARDHGDAGSADTLAWAMADYLDREGYWREWAECAELALNAAQTPAARARAYRGIAGAAARLHRFEAARDHHERACEQYGLAGDILGRADAYLSLSEVQIRMGRLAEALVARTRALELYRLHGDEAGQATAQGGIGHLHALLGDYPSAQAECGEALTRWWRLGDRAATAPVLDSLGYIHHRCGRHDDAVRHYRAALALYQQADRRADQAAVWTRLGDVHSDADREDQARAAWRAALSILDELGQADAADVRARLAASHCHPPATVHPLRKAG